MSGGTDEGTLASVVHRNIRTLLRFRAEREQRKGRQQRVADAITRFTGSMVFVYLHAFLFGGWILVNVGVISWIRPFDPFPFVMLAMAASVEAIFLSTFVLISQNRMGELQERRAELDLQVNLLAEHELTQLVRLVHSMAERMGVQVEHFDEIEEDVRPEQVLAEIEKTEKSEKSEKSEKTTEDH